MKTVAPPENFLLARFGPCFEPFMLAFLLLAKRETASYLSNLCV